MLNNPIYSSSIEFVCVGHKNANRRVETSTKSFQISADGNIKFAANALNTHMHINRHTDADTYRAKLTEDFVVIKWNLIMLVHFLLSQ